MSIIKILSETLVNQIAAGEVIERPASCVKELVENSLDSGANSITVEVRDGGRTFVKVSDNGSGMSRGDAGKAILRHATSKISSEQDLWKIGTMGFRGEALASIASVSRFVLKSKVAGAASGVEIVIEGGDVKTVQDCGMSEGTQIEVHDLFFNTPARAKYLKKDSTEIGHIATWLNSMALARPEVGFTLIHNDKKSFQLPSGSSLERRIADVFGTATKDAMIPIFYGGTDFGLSGFVGKPAISRGGSKYQYIFVNRRPISHYLIAYKVKEAFKSLLMEGENPVFILNIEIDPGLIDVNVHPRKVEIRFEDQQRILEVVYSSVKAALEKSNLTPLGVTEAGRYMSDKFPVDSSRGSSVSGGGGYSGGAGSGSGSERFSGDFAGVNSFPGTDLQVGNDHFGGTPNFDREQGSLDIQGGGVTSLKAITQVSNAYIVAQNEDGLVLIDQHAAHERVRYFELLDQFDGKTKNVQPLLMPEDLKLPLDELTLLRDNLETFEKLGFELSEGPDNSMVLYAVPSVLSGEDAVEVVGGVLDDIAHSSAPTAKQGRTETILNYMSCRSAVKFGQKLSIDEMDALLRQMEKIDRPYTCPHGRPTMISLTFGELEKMFGRK
ncbi:DNA mismatch repair endonuclease MutL [Candidatus Peregrinibacteria bacterium]|nr:DNA mismatch repair endonuclease MutL [Candidatus Peregrinibacteria bacterium]MBT4056025.1 DNA mismatch repair endonuclease MutL [Candidatus Peregrinibacteria bacterium]